MMQWNDDQVDRKIGVLLRHGVLMAASMVLLSGLWFLLHFGMAVPNYHTFKGEPADLRTVSGVFGGAIHGDPRCLIQFGLLVLIATPILRVAFSVFAFALQRDRLYVTITLLVLAVLVGSLSGLVHSPH